MAAARAVWVVHAHKLPQPRYDLIPLAETAVAAFVREPSGRRASFSNNQDVHLHLRPSPPTPCTSNTCSSTLPLSSHHHTRVHCSRLRPTQSSRPPHPPALCSEEPLPPRRPRPASSSLPPPDPRSHRRSGQQLPPSPSTAGGATTRKISLPGRTASRALRRCVGEGGLQQSLRSRRRVVRRHLLPRHPSPPLHL